MSGKPTHGLSYTPEYRAWQTMRLRCVDPTNAAYPDYGGRGITVCERWLNSVEAFVADMGPKPTPAHELDRENNDGNYEPDNCRWVTRKVNDRNRRSNRFLTFGGETLCVAEWCERLGLPCDTVHKRLEAGWSIEQTLTVPNRLRAPNGKRKPQKGRSCVDCGKTVYGERCKSCENRRRWREKAAA
jgi:hypothetical protein